MTGTPPDGRSTTTSQRVAAAWVLGLVALGFAGWFGEQLVDAYAIGRKLRFGIQAAIMSGLVVPGVWLLRRKLDQRPFGGLEMLGFSRSLRGFGLGSGLILVPTAITMISIVVFGWAKLSINPAPGAVATITAGILTAFFFEALPEELIFRDYIFRNLNGVMRKWTASLTTVALFVLLPIFLVQIQSRWLGMEIQIGPSDHITTSYLLIMCVFGSFLQYLRVMTGTVWTGIGFHLFFLMANRIMGVKESSFILMSDMTGSQGPMQAVLIGSVVLCFGALFLAPRFTGRSLGWSEVNPE
jgi:uncharacterized protein